MSCLKKCALVSFDDSERCSPAEETYGVRDPDSLMFRKRRQYGRDDRVNFITYGIQDRQRGFHEAERAASYLGKTFQTDGTSDQKHHY